MRDDEATQPADINVVAFGMSFYLIEEHPHEPSAHTLARFLRRRKSERSVAVDAGQHRGLHAGGDLDGHVERFVVANA